MTIAGEFDRREGSEVLSFGQERLWFQNQIEPSSPAFNIASAAHLIGPLDVPAFERTIREIRRRHQVLRTIFSEHNGRPRPQICDDDGWTLPILDIAGGVEEAEQILDREAQRAFDLAQGPLFRTLLLRLGKDDHVLATTFHHIICDGWSFAVLTRELEAIYPAFVSGKPSPLPELGIQYPDFALWQRARLQGKVLEQGIAWWTQYLGTDLPVLEIPSDRPRLARRSSHSARVTLRFPAEITGRLRDLSRNNQVTLFMTLTAVFEVLLMRYCRQEDIVVGVPIASRGHVGTRDLMGFFVNTIALRVDLSGNPTFQELLTRVRKAALGAFAHHEIPINVIAQHLRLSRSPDRDPLFQAMVAMEPPMPDAKLAGIESTAIPMVPRATTFELTLAIIDQEQELTCRLDYATDLFATRTIERMAAHFLMLGESAARTPEKRLSELPLLTDKERTQLLGEWNQTSSLYPDDQRIEDEFRRLARLRPDAPAISSKEGEPLSYGELDDRSSRLASYLREQGVAAGSHVALCMERSAEMIVGMLAILKAGGVYVPLDPSFPAERLRFLVNEVGAPVILTLSEASSSLPSTTARLIFLDSDWPAITEHEPRTPRANGTPLTSRDPAYVIFTSGSTGTPKGVIVPHRAITRLVLNTNYLELCPQDRIAHLSNVCFDAATFEIWGALLSGACVVLISREVSLDPRRFASELGERRVTTLFVTTALFNELVALDPRIFAEVKQVLFGGEAANPQAVRQLLEGGGAPHRLLHVYGPTECTTFATFFEVTHVSEHARTIPIGRPIANTTAYVLDKHAQPAPIGVAGELYLGGPGLATGYLNEPELTRQRFVANPFASENSPRLYRTGDIVKWRSDGHIEFVGRADTQVKIRGFRIEPGEVEEIARRHLDVEDAAVIVREDVPGDRRLAAYLVPRAAASGSDWRAGLQRVLPSYMVPSVFVELDALPRTPNGKVDRRTLPVPERRQTVGEGPRNPREDFLCKLFAELLSVDSVGIDDNFFELGGHSLLAMQIISRVRHDLGIELSIATLFEHPTIRELAQAAATAGDSVERTFPLVRAPREEALPVSHFQERMLRDCQPADGKPAGGFSVTLMLCIRGELDIESLERCLVLLINRHETLRTTFSVVAGKTIQFVHPETHCKLSVIDLSNRQDAHAEVEKLFANEWSRPFDLARGPLFRSLLLRLHETDYRFVVSLHHLVYDAFSLELFFRELGALYSACRRGMPSSLSPMNLQYGDYSAWQREHIRRGKPLYESQLKFWKERLSPRPAVASLPFERRTPAGPGSEPNRMARRMRPGIYAPLDALRKENGASFFMLMLAAFKTLLCRKSDCDDISVLTYESSRRHMETNSMIGLFSNVLIIRTDLSGDPEFVEVLQRVRTSALEALERKDIPYQEVTAQLNPPSLCVVFSFVDETPLTGFDGLKVRHLYRYFPSVRWGFGYSVANRNGRLRSVAGFDTRRYEPSGVRTFIEEYHCLLESIVRDPRQKLSSLIPTPPE